MECPFCVKQPEPGDYTFHNSHAMAILDSYPVTPGHMLIIPKRHVATYFELTPTEQQAMWRLVDRMYDMHDADGWNIGINIGAAAGQTVNHVHIHMIPRSHGDMADPRGGVRGVIPDKQKY